MAGRVTDQDLDVLSPVGSKGRVTDSDLDVLHQEDSKGRLTDLDVDVLFEDIIPAVGRLTDTDLDVLFADEAPGTVNIGPGGWGFIPIGSFVDRSTYIDDYEDEY